MSKTKAGKEESEKKNEAIIPTIERKQRDFFDFSDVMGKTRKKRKKAVEKDLFEFDFGM